METQEITGLSGTENALQRAWAAGKCSTTGKDFDSAVCEVWRSLKSRDVDFAVIERVVSTHLDLQKDASQPELNFAQSRTTPELNANTRYVNLVAEKSGVDVATTLNALEQLYLASTDGRISNQRVLFPRRFAKEGDPRNDTSDVEKALKIAAGVAIGIGVCVGVYYAARAYKMFSSKPSE